ncbi:MAG TPA: hypothetical protein VF941_24340 [Clostridia bacterium]
MAKINIVCKCNNTVAADVGQNFHRGRLGWYLSYKCPKCGEAIEQDGIDTTPEEIRNALILEEGLWGLYVHESSQGASSTLNVLRKALDLPMTKVAKIKKLIPGMILTGTKTEMERLQTLLGDEKLNVTIDKVSSEVK